jgi:hypothetical protein
MMPWPRIIITKNFKIPPVALIFRVFCGGYRLVTGAAFF